MTFLVEGNAFEELYPQPDWHQKAKVLCDRAGIECKLAKTCEPPPFAILDVLVNYHSEPGLWMVGAYGVPYDEDADQIQIGQTEDYTEESKAMDAARMFVWRHLRDYKAMKGVIIVNGNEESVYELQDYCKVMKVSPNVAELGA